MGSNPEVLLSAMDRDSLGGVTGSSTLSVVLSWAAAADETLIVAHCRLTGSSGASVAVLLLFVIAVLQLLPSILQHSCRDTCQVRGMSGRNVANA